MEKAQDLAGLGLVNLGRVQWDLPTPALYEEAIRRYEGKGFPYPLSPLSS